MPGKLSSKYPYKGVAKISGEYPTIEINPIAVPDSM